MLKIQGCDLKVSEPVVLSFEVDAEELVRSLNKPECIELVEALYGQYGTEVFAPVVAEIVEEHAPKE